MNRLLRGTAVAAHLSLLSLVSGCIHTEETITHDEPRTRIEFENETAGRVF